jgi:NAD(P) transhydrogenase subunit alpha
MKIAVAKEIDPSEPRVAGLARHREESSRRSASTVAVEPGQGIKSGLPDSEFTAAGATSAPMR